MEGLVSPPFLIETEEHFDIDILTNGLADQFTPVVHPRLYGLSATYQLIVTGRKTCHNFIAGILEFEGQRGDIDGNGHVHIVRIDMRSLLDIGELSGHRGRLT